MQKAHIKFIMVFCLMVCLSMTTMASPKPDSTVVYKTINGVELTLHMFFPPGHNMSDKTTAILFFHGGGWKGGGPGHFYNQCEYFASRGMVTMSVVYRTEDQHGTTPQECVKDGKSAMRWVRVHANEFGIDPDNILAGGGSAGGHVAAALATLDDFNEEDEDTSISCRPEALVLFNPVAHNGPGGYDQHRVMDYWEDFSPAHNLDASVPPTLIMLGTKDKLFKPALAKEFQQELQDLGVRCDLILYEGQDHAFFNEDKNRELHYQTMLDADLFLQSLKILRRKPSTWQELMVKIEAAKGTAIDK